MANVRSLVNTLVIHAGVDKVAVFTQDFKQVFPEARPIKASVKEEAKLMESPLETGGITTDHKITLPVEIELSLIIQAGDYANVYRVIKQLYLNSTLLTVNTKATVYKNLIIEAIPHDEDPDTFDTITIAMKLKQIIYTAAKYGKRVKKPSNAKKVDRGTQQPKAVVPPSTLALGLQGAENKISQGYNYLTGGK